MRLTRELLRRAFMTLLAEKPIEEISIKELCDLAQVNRSTFYAHYTDLRDLLRQIEDEMFEEFSQALDNLYQPGRDGVEPVVVTTGVFQCLKDNSDLCVVTLGPHGDKTSRCGCCSAGGSTVLRTTHFTLRARPASRSNTATPLSARAASGC